MTKWIENYDKTLKMPESTVGELRSKINCFKACEIEMTSEWIKLRSQHDIARIHVDKLFLKLRDKLQNKEGKPK